MGTAVGRVGDDRMEECIGLRKEVWPAAGWSHAGSICCAHTSSALGWLGRSDRKRERGITTCWGTVAPYEEKDAWCAVLEEWLGFRTSAGC